MRDFNKLHVIALPRCATVSLMGALGILGVRIAHLGKIYGERTPGHHNASRLIRIHEQISSGDFQLEILEECDGLADYPACIGSVYEALDSHYPGSLFINVRRDSDPAGWLRSAEMQFVGLQLTKTGVGSTAEDQRFMRAMTDFRRMTFGSSAFEPDVFRRAYERHQLELRRYFAGRNDVLLDIPDVGLLPEHGFPLLCRFLQCEEPAVAFPRNNQHSLAPQQAFLEKLAKGEIVSTTGIQPGDYTVAEQSQIPG